MLLCEASVKSGREPRAEKTGIVNEYQYKAESYIEEAAKQPAEEKQLMLKDRRTRHGKQRWPTEKLLDCGAQDAQ